MSVIEAVDLERVSNLLETLHDIFVIKLPSQNCQVHPFNACILGEVPQFTSTPPIPTLVVGQEWPLKHLWQCLFFLRRLGTCMIWRNHRAKVFSGNDDWDVYRKKRPKPENKKGERCQTNTLCLPRLGLQ